MDFGQIREQYEQLTVQLREGQVKQQDYIAAVTELRTRDEEGRWWTIEPAKGHWLVWENDAWVPGQPPALVPPGPPPAPAEEPATSNVSLATEDESLPDELPAIEKVVDESSEDDQLQTDDEQIATAKDEPEKAPHDIGAQEEVIRCAECGSRMASDQRFCGQCGSARQGACPECGESNISGTNFCPNCGHGLNVTNRSASRTRDDVPFAPPRPSAPPPARMASTPPAPPPPAYHAPAQGASLAVEHNVYEFKGIMPRFFATLIDTILLAIIGGALIFMGTITDDESLLMIGYGAYILISLAYVLLLEAGGGTLGKRVLGMRIVSAKDGGSPGLGRSIVRNLVRIVDALPLFYLIGLITISGSDKKQRLGDRIAGTYVVKT